MKRIKMKRIADCMNQQGVTTVEVILVLVILLAVVVVFREQLMDIVNDIFSHVNSSISELY